MIQPPRSRFMITDILSSDARDALIKHHNHYLGLQVSSNSSDGRRSRSRSPHEPNHRSNGGLQGDRHEDSDSDLSGGSDDHSDMCSNGGKDEDGNSMNSSLELNGTHGLSKKQRKARTAFTDNQLQTLEKTFERQKYLSVQDRMEMANKLGLNDTQVKTWYQNRRTKWKRQTAVGLELLAEAGNYAAFQRLYGSPPFTGAWPYGGQGPPGAQPTAADIYYRQAAVAALQKPHPYRMYPEVHPSLGALSAMAGQNTPFQHLSAFSSLSSLSSLYHHNAGSGHTINSGGNPPGMPVTTPHSTPAAPTHPHSSPARSPSPTLDPGSPPGRSSNHSHASDDEESIQV